MAPFLANRLQHIAYHPELLRAYGARNRGKIASHLRSTAVANEKEEQHMAFNILVIDDSDTMRAVIKKTVLMSGVQIGEFCEASNGKLALQVLEDTWIDVVLSDINMPIMGGVDFLREVKKDDVLKNIPVIFISTESSQARMDEVVSLGAAGYVKKPFLPEKIREVLIDVLNKAYATRMAEEGNCAVPTVACESDF
jgi:two-component system chemotaxis response regulator CheY